MKNMLIRAGVSPLENFDVSYMLNHNLIGNNLGNLVYAYSVFRTLMTESVESITHPEKLTKSMMPSSFLWRMLSGLNLCRKCVK